ncbi:DEAD/DEAH box helicase [Amnibacterium endophyticum]|uniref:DEAD/DEAH box helicase n=1 Tax=Amnibacterium endophyticum TaxID=2109337 RepID=A0ABW4LHE3_9MICO
MPTQSFADLGVPSSLLPALTERGITEPFPIQSATLPDSLAGRDVLGRGRTGSGKTLAFSLPLVARLSGGQRRSGRPRGLVLAPTRELATQIAAVLEPLAAAAGMRITTVFGGVSQRPQETALKGGVDIVVACPGRLEDLLSQRVLTLDDVQVTVLDEADHMADMGFLPGVTRILSKTPERGQRLLFSATLDNGVDKLVQRFLHRPVTHSVDDGRSAVETMEHAVLEVADADAKKHVMEALASGTDRRILFVRTKHVAKRLAKQLTAAGIPAADLQGNLSQNARERNLAAFSTGGIRVLVATDVAARGVHVDDVALVVHVDPPTEHKAYLHRSGRTARAGASGTVVTLVLPEQRRDVAALLRAAGIKATPTSVTATRQEVEALLGEVAPKVAPTAVAAPVQPQRKPARQGEPRRTGEGRGQGGARRQAEPGQGGQRRQGDAGQGGQRRQGESRRSGEPQRSGRQQPARGGQQGPRRSAPTTVRFSTATPGSGIAPLHADQQPERPQSRRGPRRASRP